MHVMCFIALLTQQRQGSGRKPSHPTDTGQPVVLLPHDRFPLNVERQRSGIDPGYTAPNPPTHPDKQ